MAGYLRKTLQEEARHRYRLQAQLVGLQGKICLWLTPMALLAAVDRVTEVYCAYKSLHRYHISRYRAIDYPGLQRRRTSRYSFATQLPQPGANLREVSAPQKHWEMVIGGNPGHEHQREYNFDQ